MNKKLVLGIDEAGRGPVIGPLVVVGVAVMENELHYLEELGVKDSKQLSRSEREKLYEEIIPILSSYRIYIIHPQEIDRAVYNNKLNELELNYFSNIISELSPNIAIIDSPSKNTEKIINYIKSRLGEIKDIEIIAENKADSKYTIVAVASILAKVIRDKEIDKIKEVTGIDFGSGYPSDPKTRHALKYNYSKLKDFIRKSWKTVRSKKQRSLEEFL